jgi:hypothetical protein
VLFAGGEELLRGTVGTAGGFAVEVTPGTYSVTARSETAAGSWPAPVTVAAGGRARGIEIRLGAPGAIAGIVTGADGTTVRGASVAVSPHEAGGEFARAETDASGRFAVEALGAGTYDIAVTAEGFTRAVRSGLALLASERVELEFALERSGGVAGTVKDGAGHPLAGVRVRAVIRREAAPGAVQAEARTDETGEYRLGGLEAGPVQLIASREDASSGAPASVDVPAGSWAKADFTLAETGRLEGLVTRSDRGRVGAAVVVVLPRGSLVAAATAKVDADGRYGLQLAAGEYSVFAASGDASPDGRHPPVPPSPVKIGPGQVALLDLVLKGPADASAPVVVQVLEPGGHGSAGTLVMITAKDDLRQAGSGVTDEEGFARVELSERGGLKVRAYRGGRVGGPVPVAESGPTVVALRAAGRIRGRVVAKDGAPPAGFTLEVVALGDDASVASSIGGDAGVKSAHGVEAPRGLEFSGDRFELEDIPAGPVRVSVRTPSGRSGHAELELAPGELRDVEVVLAAGATVEGRVVDAKNRSPVAGASVIVLGEARSPQRPEATTDADGRFKLAGLQPGARRLRLVAPRYAAVERDAELDNSGNVDLGDIALAGAPDTTATR